MRTSTLCFIALACLMSQFTQALPVNLKRGTDTAAGNHLSDLDSASGAITHATAPGSNAEVVAGAAASQDNAIAVAGAESNGGGPEFAKSKTVTKDIGPVHGSAAAAVAGALDKNDPGAAVAGAGAGGVGVDGIASTTLAGSAGKAVGQGGATEGGGVAGTVNVNGVGTLEAAKTGEIGFVRPGEN